MSLSLENAVNQKVATVFAELGLDNKFASVKVSDRPDLSDFQCNVKRSKKQWLTYIFRK